ncbi:MAG: dihydroorotate dehydrogenase (quinone), partial [Elusimicrobia bacterium]|nr:dihydroorotate dehydrogenase (quinone) [Elusimicrobiota bacterium]
MKHSIVIYENLLRPVLFSLDAEKAHEIVLRCLRLARSLPGAQGILSQCFTYAHPSLETQVCGMKFKNPIGLAAGFDKNCEFLDILFSFGFGFLEGGTVTFQAQDGNPKPRIFRFPQEKALINRLGFNNRGAEWASRQLKPNAYSRGPIGLNIGKSKVAPLEEAVEDYLFSFEKLYPFADYVAINVSSPNTPG